METTLGTNTIKTATDHPYPIDYGRLSHLFIYPVNEDFIKKVEDVYAYLFEILPAAAEELKQFADFTASSTLAEVQELFLRSFDLQAVTTLDIGFILFGEDYKRGQLLVHLNSEHKNAGNECYTELSDHLPNILNLLSKMKDENMRCEISVRLLIPAVLKMIDEFSTEKVEKKDEVYKKHHKVLLESSKNSRLAYQGCLKALFLALENEFGYDAAVNEFLSNQTLQENSAENNENISSCSGSAGQVDFTKSIEKEMKTE